MRYHNHLGIIGSGASAIYVLKHLLDHSTALKPWLGAISVFERSGITGMGMPYSPLTTDRYNMANISSREIPPLTASLAEWLQEQAPLVLEGLDLNGVEINEDAIYSRLALGQYLKSQYQALIAGLSQAGFDIHEHVACEIADVRDRPGSDAVILTTMSGAQHFFDRVIIATGHHWAEQDDPSAGYYASPWPMKKILPGEGQHHCFTVGTLGSSLSAFDVIISLAHRHGRFARTNAGLKYEPHAEAGGFKLCMHSAHGLLPHLQFALKEPLRTIYRHVGRRAMLDLVSVPGSLRLETYFDRICRPALREAFAKDHMPSMVERMADPKFKLEDLVEMMTAKHEYVNPFEGMRFEMKEARDSVLQHRPIYWKEVIDDLFYTLNYHAELLPAEDHHTLKAKVLPFLLNLGAAMPLTSGEALLALYDAGKLELVSGSVSLPAVQPEAGVTTIYVKEGDREVPLTYRMFIDCRGQQPLELDDYPFPSLVKDGTVRKARVPFLDFAESFAFFSGSSKVHLIQEAGHFFYPLGGVEIDGTYRLVGDKGRANPRIYDIAFPHISGIRPLSYGLQACSDTGAILVQAWIQEIKSHERVENDAELLTKIYAEI